MKRFFVFFLVIDVAEIMSRNQQIVQEIQQNPLGADWEALAIRYQVTVPYLKNIYNKQVAPEDHARRCVEQLTSEHIAAAMQEHTVFCSHCHMVSFTPLMSWKEVMYCDQCHSVLFHDQIETAWKMVHARAVERNQTTCSICDCELYNASGKPLKRMHYDHINMFEKIDSIHSMIVSGVDIDAIFAEIDMCRLLCVSCHHLITVLERVCGFFRLKLVHTRNDSHEPHASSYVELYAQFKQRAYDTVRGTVQSLRLNKEPSV